MLKKLILLGLGLLFSQIASAKVTELDNWFPDECRQQLMASTDDYPLVMVYRSDEPDQGALMRRYEMLSAEYAITHPTRQFFKFDMAENGYNWQAYSACTQQQGILGTPSLMIFFKFRYEISGKQHIYMFGPLRLDSGDLTREAMIKLAEMTPMEQSALTQQFTKALAKH